MTDTMREKIARALRTRVAPLDLPEAADAVLALIEPVMEENERLIDSLILKARIFERSINGPTEEMEKAQRDLLEARAALSPPPSDDKAKRA